MKKKIYLSGQMTGIKNYNFDKFFEIEKYLKKLNFKVINPARLTYKLMRKKHKKINEISREEYLKYDLQELLKCDFIYMLKDWENSKGAKLEYQIALEIGIKVLKEK
jgi:hypothetical protein